MHSYPRLAQRLYNTPLLIHPDKAAVIAQVFQAMAAGGTLPEIDREMAQQRESDGLRADLAARFRNDQRAQEKPYRITENGTAVIPVIGTTVHRGSWLDAWSGLTSYQRLTTRVDAAAGDPDVRGVLFDLDTPGGEAAGLFDFSDHLLALREQKPIWGIANEEAFSAGYAIGSSLEKIYAPRTGMVGSVGVVMLFVDQSEADAKAGKRYEYIHAGARKVDYNPHAPLSDAARANAQRWVDDSYHLFVEHVAKARGISADLVRKTEAGLFTAPEAVANGFIDGIGTFDETLDALEDSYPEFTGFSPRASARSTLTGDNAMSNQQQNPADPQIASAITQQDLEAARADGRTAGVTEERQRVSGILGHAEAKGRTDLAHKCVSTGLSVEQAAELLAASPKQAAVAIPDLALAGQVAVGPDGEGISPDDPRLVTTSWNRAFGIPGNA